MHASSFIDLDVWEFAPTTAPYWKAYWGEAETAEVCDKRGATTALKPDRVVLVPPGVMHAGRSRERTRKVFLHFSTELRWTEKEIISVAAGAERRAWFGQLRDALAAQSDERAAEVHFVARAILHAVLAALPASGWDLRPRDRRLARALRVMETSFPAATPMARLAREAGLSESALLRLFKAHMGETPHAWLIRRRVEAACVRLHHADESIETIAEDHGFCDRQHFTRHFARLMRCGPAEYRRQMVVRREFDAE